MLSTLLLCDTSTNFKSTLPYNQPLEYTYLQAPLKNVLDLKCEFHGKSREISDVLYTQVCACYLRQAGLQHSF